MKRKPVVLAPASFVRFVLSPCLFDHNHHPYHTQSTSQPLSSSNSGDGGREKMIRSLSAAQHMYRNQTQSNAKRVVKKNTSQKEEEGGDEIQ
jgi:hypothetical protein